MIVSFIRARRLVVVLMRLGQMRDHVGEDDPDVLIIDGVAHVTPLALRPQDAPGTQQPEVVGGKGLRHRQRVAEGTDASLPLHAGEHEAEAVLLAEQTEHIRQPADIVMGQGQPSVRYI